MCRNHVTSKNVTVLSLCPPTKGEREHISFSADPGRRRRRRRRRDNLYPPYF